jgi:inner membrane protein
MDSLSQIVLGAAVGEIAWGRKMGNRAQLIGAIGGTIPDLDILFNSIWTDPIDQLRIHRGYSHSMFIHLLMAIPFAWVTWRWMKTRITWKESYIVWYLFFFTHTLLDCCTTYGTQLFLPFTDYLVGFNTISVVDPLWTVPFLFALLVCLFMKRTNPRRLRWAKWGAAYSLVYLGVTMVNKGIAHSHFSDSLEQKGIPYNTLSTSPSILNSILWSGVAVTSDSIYIGEYSVLQDDPEVDFVSYARGLHHLDPIASTREVKTLQWFSQDLYFCEQSEDTTHFYLIKWGRMDYSQTKAEDAFVFYWELVRSNAGLTAKQIQADWDDARFNDALKQLLRRIRNK